MSWVSFESVSTPELSSAITALRRWVEQHRGHKFVEPELLFRDIGGNVNPEALVRVLVQLVAARQLEQKFRVLLPDGTLSEDEFSDPDDVPPVIFDSSFQPFEVTKDRIKAVFNMPI